MASFHFWKDISRIYQIPSFFGRTKYALSGEQYRSPQTQETNMTTITLLVAFVIFFSPPVAPASSAPSRRKTAGAPTIAASVSGQN